MTETLLPFLKPSSAGARIIIMSSFLGQLKVCNPNLLTWSDYSSAYNQTSVRNLICISARFFIKLLWIRMAWTIPGAMPLDHNIELLPFQFSAVLVYSHVQLNWTKVVNCGSLSMWQLLLLVVSDTNWDICNLEKWYKFVLIQAAVCGNQICSTSKIMLWESNSRTLTTTHKKQLTNLLRSIWKHVQAGMQMQMDILLPIVFPRL